MYEVLFTFVCHCREGQVDDVEHEDHDGDDDGEDVHVVAEQGNKEVEPDLPTLQEPQD